MEIERLKFELERDEQLKNSKKQHLIQDSKAYYNEQFNKKKEIEDQRLNEKTAKINTSFNIKDEERREEYKRKLLKMTENMEKNADTYMEYNSNNDNYRNRYGNKNLLDQLRSGSKKLIIIFDINYFFL